ncbi:MAG: hypothetical protein GVY17_00035 [Cyanobacteria bacterium]|nr:hypothetical protein [Cyanobacteria bacterium GSL.Bin21]
MTGQRLPLENYVVADWLAQQCQVSQRIIHRHAVRQRLRYYLFMGVRYLERNDAIALVKYLIQQRHNIDLPKIVGAIELRSVPEAIESSIR